MKKVLVIGAGAQGGPCASILAGEEGVEKILIGDIDLDLARKVTCPPKTDPSRMRGLVKKEAKNAKRKKIHTRANHHQIA